MPLSQGRSFHRVLFKRRKWEDLFEFSAWVSEPEKGSRDIIGAGGGGLREGRERKTEGLILLADFFRAGASPGFKSRQVIRMATAQQQCASHLCRPPDRLQSAPTFNVCNPPGLRSGILLILKMRKWTRRSSATWKLQPRVPYMGSCVSPNAHDLSTARREILTDPWVSNSFSASPENAVRVSLSAALSADCVPEWSPSVAYLRWRRNLSLSLVGPWGSAHLPAAFTPAFLTVLLNYVPLRAENRAAGEVWGSAAKGGR